MAQAHPIPLRSFAAVAIVACVLGAAISALIVRSDFGGAAPSDPARVSLASSQSGTGMMSMMSADTMGKGAGMMGHGAGSMDITMRTACVGMMGRSNGSMMSSSMKAACSNMMARGMGSMMGMMGSGMMGGGKQSMMGGAMTDGSGGSMMSGGTMGQSAGSMMGKSASSAH